MNGQDILNQLASIMSGEIIDPTYGLQLINIARMDFEFRRPWNVIKAKDTSQIAQAGKNYTVPLVMPSPSTPTLASPYLMRYLLNGSIELVNSSNSNQRVKLLEIPYENQLDYQGGNYFYSDYANRKFYILAYLPSSYTVYQFFTADYGEITTISQWVGFPSRFWGCLAYQAAARYRLGTDYDDIASRNGNDNYKASEAIYRSMVEWDSNISQQISNNRSLGGINGGGNAGQNYWPGPSVYGGYDGWG